MCSLAHRVDFAMGLNPVVSGRTRFVRFRRSKPAQFEPRRRYDGARFIVDDVPQPRDHEAEDVHVLLVEDRSAVREAIAAALDREPGFTVEQAASLAEAREMLEGVDVAILDLGLPDGSGAVLIPELHAVNPDAMAVVLTSSVDPAETERALQRGAAAVLSKLVDFEEVIATVRRLRDPRSS